MFLYNVIRHIIPRYTLQGFAYTQGGAVRQQSQEDLARVSAYIPKSLYKAIAERAKKERRSVSSEIVILIEKTLAKLQPISRQKTKSDR